MEEVQSNQDSFSLWGFSDRGTDAMFVNNGASSSSLQAGRWPVIARTPRRPSHMHDPLYDREMVGNSQLGVGIHHSDNFVTDQSLSFALQNMRLSFWEGGGDTPIQSFTMAAPSTYPGRTSVSSSGNSNLSSALMNNFPCIACPGCSCGDSGYLQIQLAETDQYGTRCSWHDHLNVQRNDSLCFDWHNSQYLSSVESGHDLVRTIQRECSSMDEFVANICLLAKDQNGCRLLQRIFTNAPEEAEMIFDGIIEQISELMVDPFGKYLVQQLLQKCDTHQKMHIICETTKLPGRLIEVACDMHGSFVVRKMVDTVNTPTEAYMIVSALSPGALTLMMDAHGSHVARRCLQKLSPDNKKFLLDAAIKYCFELAHGCHSCRILNLCIDNANKDQRDELLYNITSRSRALDLSRHKYGNYVIQHILGLEVMWATDNILDQLEGHNGYLSMQQCGSNVVEKCIKAAQQPRRLKIIQELINYPNLHRLLHDKYGNYVIQTALRQCENATLRSAFIEAIEQHAASLRNIVYGNRILPTVAACRANLTGTFE